MGVDVLEFAASAAAQATASAALAAAEIGAQHLLVAAHLVGPALGDLLAVVEHDRPCRPGCVTTSSLCSISRMVSPSACSALICSASSSVSAGFMPAVGSSSSSSAGARRARGRSRRGGGWRRTARRTVLLERAAAAGCRTCRGCPSPSSARAVSSRRVAGGRSTARRRRRCAAAHADRPARCPARSGWGTGGCSGRCARRPRLRISVRLQAEDLRARRSGCCRRRPRVRPVMTLNSVDLPEPFGPITATTLPAGTVRSTLVQRDQARRSAPSRR